MMWCTFRFDVALTSPCEKEPARKLTGSEFARTMLGFEPDFKQQAILDSASKRGILNCSRQWGKSTVAAAKAVHRAYSEPGGLVLVSSPTDRQSGEFIRKAATFARRLGVRRQGDGDNRNSIVFPNGSRIVGLPGTEATVRGFSAVSLLLIDEASRVPDAMYKALLPMLAVGDGDLWIMSTPYGKRGFFWEEWAHGGEVWERVSAPATECSRISREYLARGRKSLGKEWFAQEFLCDFVDNGSQWFGRDMVEQAVRDEKPLKL